MLRLSLPELITASNAAILGATTAPALAAAKGWKDLVTPGVLVGVLGYAIGTPIATLVFELWPG
ncbi:MAG: putative membrane protein [Maricaulis maris]